MKACIDEMIKSVPELDDISQRIDAGLINSTGEKIQNLYINPILVGLFMSRLRVEGGISPTFKSDSEELGTWYLAYY